MPHCCHIAILALIEGRLHAILLPLSCAVGLRLRARQLWLQQQASLSYGLPQQAASCCKRRCQNLCMWR